MTHVAAVRSYPIVLALAGVLIGAGCRSTDAASPPAVAWRNGAALAPAPARPLDLDAVSEASRALSRFDAGGTVRGLRWDGDAGVVTWQHGDERYHLAFDEGVVRPGDGGVEAEASNARARGRRPGRGRQRAREASPDGAWTAVARDWNVVLEPSEDDASEIPVTTDGTRKHRYGMASWVYGEELNQLDAMFWSPDSSMLAFYAFDEREVPDFVLLDGWTELRPTPVREGYPKPGEPNPVATLMVYHLDDGRTVPVDVMGDPGDEWYVYQIRFTPDGELLFNRTNRHQNVLEVMIADPSTGTSRLVVREQQDTWQENRPNFRFLRDGRRFVWETERDGVRRFELRDLDGTRIAELTPPDVPAIRVMRIDEDANAMWFTAYSDADPLYAHLHRVDLDGTNGRRLTPRGASHTPTLGPGGWFVTRAETIETPPRTTLHAPDGRTVAVLAEPDPARVAELGYPAPERFSFLADDGVTTVFGVLYRPRDFDPMRAWPLIVDVYGGPGSRAVSARFRPSHAATALGACVARIDGRGTGGRDKAFMGAVYQQLGTVDLNDQADGARALAARPSIDAARVGIYGHSYGGYMAALAILKHGDIFTAAAAGAPVTDWRNYDTIYTERYMRTPQENETGYVDGSCMTYAENLEGALLLQHGMMDDNVHPTNTFQLVDALQRAGKTFELMVYPESAHGLGRGASAVRWRFLHRHLVEPVSREAPSVVME